MPDLPEEAVQAAVRAHECAWVSGASREAAVREVLKAAAPFIAAQTLIRERRRALRLVRRTLVPRGCEPSHDAAELIKAIKGDLRV